MSRIMIAELILLLFVAGSGLCSNTYYVTPNHDTLCPEQPCLTLSQYVQQSDRYFTSNTTFVFLAGDHSLHNDLALEDIPNITLIGDTSSLPKITSKIRCTRSVNIDFNFVSKIVITALAFASCGKETSHVGAIYLTDVRDVSFSDCIFRDNAFTALSAIQSSLFLSKVVFTNNSESALRISSSTVTSIHNVTFSNNSGDQGGAAAIISSFVNFIGTTAFENNSGNYGGSLYLEHTTVRFTGIHLFRNSYASDNITGGVLYAGSARFVSYSSFINNSAHYQGGGICAYNSTMNFEGDSSFINNPAYYGGGILAYNSTMNFEEDSSFINNSADYGGGIYAYNSIMNFEGNSSFRFVNNSADDTGGGIRAYNTTMNFEGDSSFINNSAENGGGIRADNSTMNFEGYNSFINNSADGGGGILANNSITNFKGNSSFNNNSANYEGGGILADDSTMNFEGDSNFINNSADFGEGILAYNSTMNFEGDSNFINNSADHGGGILAYNSTMNFEGDSNFINNSADYGGGICANNNTIFFAGDSSFINNSANYQGGGIFFYISSTNFKGDSSFINNAAEEGGGILAYDGIMSFKGDSSFINNSADYGGGIYTLFSTMNFEGDCSVFNNSADTGGGILAYTSTMNFEGESSITNNSADNRGGGILAYISTMNFEGSSIIESINNSADFGGGVYAHSSIMHFNGNSSFINNCASIEGGGIMAITNTTINFDGNCRHDKHSATNGGGIMAVTSTMNFYGTCSFINNSATHNGGGIALDSSTVYLFQQRDTRVYFTGNHAKRGGAINAFDSLYELSQYCYKTTRYKTTRFGFINCFLQIDPFEFSNNTVINVSLNFENNSASEGGDLLYGGSTDYCNNTKNHSRDLIESLVSGLSEDKLSDISSDPIKVCVCDITKHPDCNRNINVITYPGKSFNVNIVAVGQRNGTVAAVIQSIFDKESTANLKAEENLQSSNKACTPLTYTVFSNTSSERIDLYAEGLCGPGVGQPLSITVELQPCPDGFELSPTTRACICENRLQTYTNSCDINSQTIIRVDNVDFWVGYDNETGGLILHPHCPFDYCTIAHVSFTLNDTDVQCNYNRSGILCGKCQTDFSLVLGTSRCLECPNEYLSLLAAFALAGLLLVVFLLICRLTVAVGTISGLIFYANVVAVNQSIFFPQDPNIYTKFLNVFIAWLNLDLGIETCFYNGMDAYAKTWLQFVFPIYIWVLVGIVIISSRYLQIVARTLGTNPVAVLATLFLLSYTKILRTILAALSFTNLQYPNDITQTVWLYDGNITYFGGRHIPLFITAIIMFFALFFPYTLLLLLGQCFQAKSNWRLLAWVNSPRFKTIMDAYYGPYRDERRYWPGLLLVIRFILLLVFSSNAHYDPSVNLLAIITCTLGLFTFTWLIPGIYTKWYLEVLEVFSILNLTILATATYHVRASGGSQAAVVYTSVGAAFVVFLGIIAYHMYLQISDIRKERKIRNNRRLRALLADEEIEAARAAAENQVPSQLDLERVISDETRALVPTTEVVVCKRETLLAMEAELADNV